MSPAQLILDALSNHDALISKHIGEAMLLEAQAAPRVQHKSKGAVRYLRVCKQTPMCVPLQGRLSYQ